MKKRHCNEMEEDVCVEMEREHDSMCKLDVNLRVSKRFGDT